MPRSLLLSVVSLLLVAACSAGAPGSPSPTLPGPCCTPPITAAPTATAAPSPSAASTAGYSCDPDMGYGCDASPSPATTTPTPAGEPLIVSASDDGSRLVGPTLLTLYVFDNDSPGQSACNAGCSATWPPLTLAAGQELAAQPDIAANFSTFTRADGSTQVAYNGRPLYHYGNDASPGDIRGDGIGGVWHIAAP